MLYAVTATITRHRDGWNSVHNVPTFYLDDTVQGIVNAEHAERIAHHIVRPQGDDESVSLVAYPVS